MTLDFIDTIAMLQLSDNTEVAQVAREEPRRVRPTSPSSNPIQQITI